MPFTEAQFTGVFAAYNTAVWPAQVILTLLALAIVALAALGGTTRSRVAAAALGVLWIWTGLVYHVGFFAAVNPAANLFGALFVAQGLLLLYGARQDWIAFRFHVDGVAGWLGAALALYALAIYPLLGGLLGHVYPAAPTFGAPCPVTILTFAMLLWSLEPPPLPLLAVPVVWSFIGGSAAVAFGMWEDLVMVAAGVGVLALAVQTRIHGRTGAVRLGRGA